MLSVDDQKIVNDGRARIKLGSHGKDKSRATHRPNSGNNNHLSQF